MSDLYEIAQGIFLCDKLWDWAHDDDEDDDPSLNKALL